MWPAACFVANPTADNPMLVPTHGEEKHTMNWYAAYETTESCFTQLLSPSVHFQALCLQLKDVPSLALSGQQTAGV